MAHSIRRRLLSLAVLVPLLSSPRLLAGGSVDFEANDGADAQRVQFEFDGNKLRMTPLVKKGGDQPEAYSIFRDGKMYSVVNSGGKYTVMDMGSMMKMLGGAVANAAKLDTGLDDIAEYHGLNATGKSETHAGITGEVYTVDYTTRAGKREKIEMVLARNATLVEMGSSMAAFSEMMAKAMGQPSDTPGAKALEAEFKRKNLGILRVDDGLRVVRVSGSAPAADRFKLPAAPTAMPAMPAGFEGLLGGARGGGAAAAAADAADAAEAESGVVNDKVERQKERVKSRADREVDEATDRSVDKVLDKAFDKLFGR
ncbi:MAG: hypothetical protein ACT6T0_10010 [Nevskia sp.]|uniref:hypothetical protein n=1 Tax=Nevskia sp. TaxID=1929292 RepID=UPI00403630AE